MITLENIVIDTLDIDSRRIVWEVVSTGESLSNYVIDFYRSEAPGTIDEFDWVVSGVEVISGMYTDSSLQRMGYSVNRNIYYFLKVRNTSTSATSNFGPYKMQSDPDLQALEIIRRHNIVFTNPRYNARTFYILKRRTWGSYCACIDPITQEPRDPNCSFCHGTGISGGYFNPLSIKGFRGDKSHRHMLNLFGVWQDTDVFFKLQNTIHVIPGDYIVDEHNERYQIQEPVNHVQKGIYTIVQNVRAKTVSHSDPIYNVDLSTELS